MKEFNVIIYEPNRKQFEPYDVIPYFVKCYKKLRRKCKEKGDFTCLILSITHLPK